MTATIERKRRDVRKALAIAECLVAGKLPTARGSATLGKHPGAADVGRKLAASSKRPPAGLRGQFTRHFRIAVGSRSPSEVAGLIGVTPDMVRKYLGGSKMPDINALPGIAKALGMRHWTEFFEKPQK